MVAGRPRWGKRDAEEQLDNHRHSRGCFCPLPVDVAGPAVQRRRQSRITLAWWLVIAGACVAIHLAEKKRRERIRTMFLAPGLVYNCETGVIRLEPGTSVVDTLQTLLGALNYSFDLAELPSNSRVRFQRIVRTSKFGDNGAIWEGELVEVAHPDRPQTFESRRELAILMGENV